MTFLAIVTVAVLIVIAGGKTSGGDTNLEGVAQVHRLLGGIPQHGMVLGNPRAKVMLIEFGDLQCPICKGYSEEALPEPIEGPVAAGRVKLDFRNFTIIGDESTAAGAAAVAAGEQSRGWNFVELFYRNQGAENTGYVNDAFLRAIAKGAGVPNLARWTRARHSPRVLAEVAETTRQAEELGFTGTPSFALQRSGAAIEPLGTLPSAGDLEAAIANAHP